MECFSGKVALRAVMAMVLLYAPATTSALRAAQPTTAWQRKVREALFGMGGVSRAPEQAKEDGNAKGQQPLAMQVTDEELKKFSEALSPDCKAQFEKMLKGEGSGIHTFEDRAAALVQRRRLRRNASQAENASEAENASSGAANVSSAPNASNVSRAGTAANASDASNASDANATDVSSSDLSASEASCRKLEGGLCFTRAHVEEAVSRGGRNMRSRVDVEGNGCLPSKCMEQNDLEVWANFMRMKAKENLPGQGITIDLHVNCSGSGGGVVHSSEAKKEF